MGKEKSRGLRRLIKAAGYSIAGYRSAWKHEEAFRMECVCAIIMIPAGLYIGSTAVQRSLLVGSCLLVIITELLNAAIEAMNQALGGEDKRTQEQKEWRKR